MKLRRAVVTVAATAAIAPAALMAAPAAFAAGASAAPTSSSPASPASTAGGQAAPSTAPTAHTTAPTGVADHSTATSSASRSGASDQAPNCGPHTKSLLTTTISGLPGKIAAGSGWHTFRMRVSNDSGTDVSQVELFAGAGLVDAENPFTTKQVALEFWSEQAHKWYPVADHGYDFGNAGWADQLPSNGSNDSYVDVTLRLSVSAKAPLGASLTVGGGFYYDEQNKCNGTSSAFYKIDIVAPSAPTGGSTPTPTTGGSVPLPGKPTSKPSGAKVTPVVAKATPSAAPNGNLAHTGASSALPTIATIGGVAVALGVGAMVVVRRRKSGDKAA